MMRFSLVTLAFLSVTANAGVCKHRPKPVHWPQQPTPSANGTVTTTTDTPSVLPSSPDVTSPNTTKLELQSNATTPDASASASASASPSLDTTAATPPEGVDKTKPWIPIAPGNTNITANPTGEDIDGSSDISKWILEYHNQVRAQYGAGPLVWNTTRAQESAAHTKTCVWAHEGADNLAEWYGSGQGSLNISVNELMDGWTKEFPETFSQPNGQGEVVQLNHLTQMVWKSATALGCSWNTDCKEGNWEYKVYLTCKFWPPTGNMQGEENTQVGKFSSG